MRRPDSLARTLLRAPSGLLGRGRRLTCRLAGEAGQNSLEYIVVVMVFVMIIFGGVKLVGVFGASGHHRSASAYVSSAPKAPQAATGSQFSGQKIVAPSEP